LRKKLLLSSPTQSPFALSLSSINAGLRIYAIALFKRILP
jgi:hypothetical protein